MIFSHHPLPCDNVQNLICSVQIISEGVQNQGLECHSTPYPIPPSTPYDKCENFFKLDKKGYKPKVWNAMASPPPPSSCHNSENFFSLTITKLYMRRATKLKFQMSCHSHPIPPLHPPCDKGPNSYSEEVQNQSLESCSIIPTPLPPSDNVQNL